MTLSQQQQTIEEEGGEAERTARFIPLSGGTLVGVDITGFNTNRRQLDKLPTRKICPREEKHAHPESVRFSLLSHPHIFTYPVAAGQDATKKKT